MGSCIVTKFCFVRIFILGLPMCVPVFGSQSLPSKGITTWKHLEFLVGSTMGYLCRDPSLLPHPRTIQSG